MMYIIDDESGARRVAPLLTELIKRYINEGFLLLNSILSDREIDLKPLYERFAKHRLALYNHLLEIGERDRAYDVKTHFDHLGRTGLGFLNDWSAFGHELEKWDFVRIGSTDIPPPKRMTCDPSERAVFLDGRQLAANLSAHQFQFVAAIVKNHPDPIPFSKIMGGNTQGRNPTRIHKSLPLAVQRIVKGVKAGYHLRLPPKIVTPSNAS